MAHAEAPGHALDGVTGQLALTPPWKMVTWVLEIPISGTGRMFFLVGKVRKWGEKKRKSSQVESLNAI